MGVESAFHLDIERIRYSNKIQQVSPAQAASVFIVALVFIAAIVSIVAWHCCGLINTTWGLCRATSGSSCNSGSRTDESDRQPTMIQHDTSTSDGNRNTQKHHVHLGLGTKHDRSQVLVPKPWWNVLDRPSKPVNLTAWATAIVSSGDRLVIQTMRVGLQYPSWSMTGAQGFFDLTCTYLKYFQVVSGIFW